MNCESVTETIPGIVSGSLPATQLADSRRHIAECQSCREALRGAEALAMLKSRDTGDVPAGLFDQVRTELARAPARGRVDRRFWLGAGLGGAVAASLFAVALMAGWFGPPANDAPEVAEFLVALSEPRMMDIAIEADRPLHNARISVFLAGGVELDGYGRRRELSWATDLKAGVNRLSLPVLAVDEGGGQVLVRLSHPQSEQLFAVRLKTQA
jgi:hypothetical protein